jgi:hypothetical protein
VSAQQPQTPLQPVQLPLAEHELHICQHPGIAGQSLRPLLPGQTRPPNASVQKTSFMHAPQLNDGQLHESVQVREQFVVPHVPHA